MILKPIAVEERPNLQLKVLAADALKSRRKDWGVTRKWESDYLVKVASHFTFLKENIEVLFQALSCLNFSEFMSFRTRSLVLMKLYSRDPQFKAEVMSASLNRH